jgi:hypothetical protein
MKDCFEHNTLAPLGWDCPAFLPCPPSRESIGDPMEVGPAKTRYPMNESRLGLPPCSAPEQELFEWKI